MGVNVQEMQLQAFLKKLDSEGRVKGVACPAEFQVGLQGRASKLMIYGNVVGTEGDVWFREKLWVGGPTGNERWNNPQGVVTAEGPQGRVQITHDSDAAMGATTTTAGNDTLNEFALHLRNNTVTPSTFTGITMTNTVEVDENSFGSAIYAQRDPNATGGGAGYDTNMHFATNTSSDNQCRVRMTLTHSGTVGIGTMDPIGSAGLGANDAQGCTHIYSTGYPQLVVEGDDHSIAYLKGSDGSEVAVNFWTHDGTSTVSLWKIGMDNTPNTYDDGFSIKQTNNQNPEFYIHTDGNVGIGLAGSVPSVMLEVNGSVSKTGGSFKIPHPDPEKASTHHLFHSFVESPTAGDNIYRWQLDVTGGSLTFKLPDYYSFLNCDDMTWVSPVGHFGAGYAEVSEDQKSVTVTCNADGKYNLLLIGTRKDQDTDHWRGVEQERTDGDDGRNT